MKTRLWKRFGSPTGWTGGLAAGLLVLAWGCERSNGPAGPSLQNPVVPADPPAQNSVSPGLLEVSITASGTRPDPDGYAVAVSMGGSASSSQAVGSEGGLVRFPELLPGAHYVRLENLAANCAVQGENPRRLVITAGETSQISFSVFCPGPGAVLVKTITTGDNADTDGYVIRLGGDSTKKVPIGASDSLLFSEADLPPAGQWGRSVAIDGVAGNCWVPRRWRTLTIRGDATTRVEFSVECMSWADFNSGTVYERVTPQSSAAIADHVTLSERYILLTDDKFRLQYESGRYGIFEYLGSYGRVDSTISFEFDDSGLPGGWSAIGTMRGDSLSVRYDLIAYLDGFEDAVFVREAPR